MNLTRKDLIAGITAFASMNMIGDNKNSALAAKQMLMNQQNNDDNEMYKQMYLLMTTGVSSFGPILIDNISTKIRRRAFSSMSDQLTHVTFNVATLVDYYGFRDALYLEEINLPACTACYSNIFTNCTNLKIVRIPNCRNLGSNAFQGSFNVEHIYIDNIEKSYAQGFPWNITTSQTIFHFLDGNYDYQGNKLA